jgi:hypothetical protein
VALMGGDGISRRRGLVGGSEVTGGVAFIRLGGTSRRRGLVGGSEVTGGVALIGLL